MQELFLMGLLDPLHQSCIGQAKLFYWVKTLTLAMSGEIFAYSGNQSELPY